VSRKSRNRRRWEELGGTERPGLLRAYRDLCFCSSLSVFVLQYCWQNTPFYDTGKETAGYLQTAATLRSLEHGTYCYRQLSSYSNPMEGRWGKLQRRGFSPNQKFRKHGLETGNSKVCFRAETQQPLLCERSHVQIIHTHDLSGKKLQFLLEREYIQPLHFNTCKTWS